MHKRSRSWIHRRQSRRAIACGSFHSHAREILTWTRTSWTNFDSLLRESTATCQPSPTIYWSTSPPKPRHLTFTSMLFQGEILTFCHLISHQVLGLSAPKYAMPVIWYLCLLYYVKKSCWISSCLVRLLYKHVCVHRVGFQLADTSCIARLICVTFASS